MWDLLFHAGRVERIDTGDLQGPSGKTVILKMQPVPKYDKGTICRQACHNHIGIYTNS